MEKRIRAFQQLGFGLFVHYGPYVQYESGEWAYELCRIDPKEYEKKALSCDYSSFDAEKIAAAAKSCGAKYVTFTTRHHDGFSLYDTRGLSDYDVVHTPNGRDLVREFVDACRRNDIVPFFITRRLIGTIPILKTILAGISNTCGTRCVSCAKTTARLAVFGLTETGASRRSCGRRTHFTK